MRFSSLYVILSMLLMFTYLGLHGCNMPQPRLINANELTTTRINITIDRIDAYYTLNKTLPMSVTELPIQPKRDCDTTDGWGRPLLWDNGVHGQITIWSYGRDGAIGGNGDDSDMTKTYIAQSQ